MANLLPDFVKPGAVLLINRIVSIQFAKPFAFRVTKVGEIVPYYEWIWLTGYQLNRNGVVVCKREIFVQQRHLTLWPNKIGS